MKCRSLRPARISSNSRQALPRPLTTATFTVRPLTLTLACLTPSSPRTASTVKVPSSRPETSQWAVRIAASITPPVAPNNLPAVVRSPNGVSAPSAGSSDKSSPCMCSSWISSRVVSTASMSATPLRAISGRAASNFLAVQGMMLTLKMFCGSIRSRWAK